MTSIDFYAKNFGQARLLSKQLSLPINRVLGQRLHLNQSQHNLIQTQITQLESGYPLDYLLGEVNFCELDFVISSSTLIPRPATEYWVNHLITQLQESAQEALSHTSNPVTTLVEVGTGSGVIGITLSKYYDYSILTDISGSALLIAQVNQDKILPENKKIQLLKTNLLTNVTLPKTSTNWTLVANLPYVPAGDELERQKNRVRHEPSIALYSGEDGLDLTRELINQLLEKHSQKMPTEIWLELDPRNICKAKKYIQEAFFDISLPISKKWIFNILTDEDDFARVLVIKQVSQ